VREAAVPAQEEQPEAEGVVVNWWLDIFSQLSTGCFYG